MSISKEDAQFLAVAYEAYCDNLRLAYETDKPTAWNSVSVWAGALLRSQQHTGVILREEDGLNQIIEQADAKIKKAEKIAV